MLATLANPISQKCTYRSLGVQNLDGIKPGLLSHTVGPGTNGTSNVSAVAVAIRSRAISSVVGKVSGA